MDNSEMFDDLLDQITGTQPLIISRDFKQGKQKENKACNSLSFHLILT